MTILLSLWLFAAALEILLYRYGSPARRLIPLVIASVVFLAASLLVVARWPIWSLAWVFGLYRLVSIARFGSGRLPAVELRKVSIRAFEWLVVFQIGSAGVCWLAADRFSGGVVLAIIISLQAIGALILLRATLHTWRHIRPKIPTTAFATKDLPSLSVLIPARNETDDLERCLEQLVASDYPKLEVIVYDDCSVTKRTPEIIRAFAHSGVRFIAGNTIDEHRWLMKNYAYDRLQQEASGELLLFCGVDIRFEPQSLRILVENLLSRNKVMVSVLPLRDDSLPVGMSLLQPMRYFWELCLPRRLFKRPPVLSSCWLIRAEKLHSSGSFAAVARSVVPEAHFARAAVIADGYSFIRGDTAMGIRSIKTLAEQYSTTVRVRYPQLHRRIELVALTALTELAVLLGPIIGLLFDWSTAMKLRYGIAWAATVVILLTVYYFVAVKTRYNTWWNWWFLFPIAVAADLWLLHLSMIRYEFSYVEWKGRNVCLPVMQHQEIKSLV